MTRRLYNHKLSFTALLLTKATNILDAIPDMRRSSACDEKVDEALYTMALCHIYQSLPHVPHLFLHCPHTLGKGQTFYLKILNILLGYEVIFQTSNENDALPCKGLTVL